MTPRLIRDDRPVDPIIIEILRNVAADTSAEGIDYMLVGATARDILLNHVFGIVARRATYDLDFAVAVKDWQQLHALHARLLARRTFKQEEAAQHRLYFVGREGNLCYQLDLVPFGAIAEGAGEIAWPPDMAVVMSVAGYDDALAAAEHVKFPDGFDIKVVSLAGLAILKLVAWSDRGRENPKDAHDLIHLMESYTAAGNFERVYDEEGVIEAGEADPDLAGVYLLGHDIRRVASAETRDVVLKIIRRDFDRLAHEMIKANRHLDHAEGRVVSRLRLLEKSLAQ